MRTRLGCLFGVLSVVGTAQGSADFHKYFLYKVVGTHLRAHHDESRIAAQIHIESSWIEDARNPSGARGLGQFMPSTANWMHSRYKIELGEYSKYSPRWSILATTLYMKYLLDRHLTDDLCVKWTGSLRDYSGGSRFYPRKVFSMEKVYLKRGWLGQSVCG